MVAYLLVLIAVLSRFLVLSHVAWLNFSAEGAALLYFGARRPWREMLTPLAIFAATDYCLTVYAYHYPFRWESYVPTWIWYVAAMVLGQILLSAKTSVWRVAAAALLGPTSFFLVSNYAVWAKSGMYPHTLAGLQACYIAAIPFYRNDLTSTTLILTAVFGLPALVRRMNMGHTQAALAGK
jgi:hypothetical protein